MGKRKVLTCKSKGWIILTDRQTAVTVFKGIAILMVVLVHIEQKFQLPEWMTYVPQMGQLGCQIFLVLSSYTLCFSVDKKKMVT